MNIPEGVAIRTNPSPYPKKYAKLFSRGNQCNPNPRLPSDRENHLFHTVAIIPRYTRMTGQDRTPRPYIWMVHRIHDDAGGLWVVFNNQMSGSIWLRKKYFIVPTTAITETDQKPKERKWQAGKDLLETFHNMRTALQKLFERSINPVYHSGGMMNTGTARMGFGNDEPPAILELLKIFYGTPSLKEPNQALLRLHEPMDRNQLLEVMPTPTKPNASTICTIFYMWIWCWSHQKCMPSRQFCISYDQNPIWWGTYVCQPGKNNGSAAQITSRWDRCRHGMDSIKQHQKISILDAAPTRFCKSTPTESTIPTPAETVLRPWKEHSATATTGWSQYVSPPPGMVVTNSGGKCRTSKCKKYFVTQDQYPPQPLITTTVTYMMTMKTKRIKKLSTETATTTSPHKRTH